MNNQLSGEFDFQGFEPNTDLLSDQTVEGGYQRIKRHIREDEVMDLPASDWQAQIVK